MFLYVYMFINLRGHIYDVTMIIARAFVLLTLCLRYIKMHKLTIGSQCFMFVFLNADIRYKNNTMTKFCIILGF